MKIKRTALVIDNGLFQSLAHRLSRDYERVLYWRPWVSSFAHNNDTEIGEGYENITRIRNYEEYFDDDEVTWVFPDLYYAPLQEWLRSKGKPVWGSGNGEELELQRDLAKQLFEEVGLPVQPWEVVTGMKALRAFIKKNEGWHVKINTTRGLTESFYAENYDLVKGKLDAIEHELGGRSEVQRFIVEEGIPESIEAGYDGYFVGDYPQSAIVGIEAKDSGYACAVVPYASIPKPVRAVNVGIAPELKKYGYAGSISTEVRIKDGKGYCIDLTCRSASPAGECVMELFTNFGEIIESGAHGELIQPVIKDKFAAQAIMTATFADENWLAITIPDEIRNNVKLYHSCRVDGLEYVVPGEYDMEELGSIVATGDTIDAAIKKVSEYADQIKAFTLKTRTDVLESTKRDLLKTIG